MTLLFGRYRYINSNNQGGQYYASKNLKTKRNQKLNWLKLNCNKYLINIYYIYFELHLIFILLWVLSNEYYKPFSSHLHSKIKDLSFIFSRYPSICNFRCIFFLDKIFFRIFFVFHNYYKWFCCPLISYIWLSSLHLII